MFNCARRWPNQRRKKLIASGPERLEHRCLLTVDLVTEFVDGPTSVVVGEQVSFTVAIKNQGTDDAIGAAVHSDLSEYLVDSTWSRVGGFPGTFSVDFLDGEDGFSVEGGGGVSIPGDINNDGIDDLLVGSHFRLFNAKPGSAYVRFGKAGIGASGHLEGAPKEVEDGFSIRSSRPIGVDVGGAGDVNADGIDDFWISERGAIHLVFGSEGIGSAGDVDLEDLTKSAGFIINGNGLGARPIAIAAGDINGDGIDDLVIQGSIKTFVIYGGRHLEDADEIAAVDLDGQNGFDVLGVARWPSSGAVDINADGLSDLVLGDPTRRRITIVFGRPDIGEGGNLQLSKLEPTQAVEITGPRNHGWFGGSIIDAGDMNGDQINDLMVLAVESGDTFVFYGSREFGTDDIDADLSHFDGTNGVILDDGVNGFGGNEIPTHVTSASGDVNGDGLSDLVIGRQFKGYFGRPFVVLGSAQLSKTGHMSLDSNADGVAGFEIVREENIGFDFSHRFGANVASGGDINGDGVDDIVVKGFSEGYAYVIFGRRTASGTGGIQDVVDIPATGSVQYRVTGTIPSSVESVNASALATPCSPQPTTDGIRVEIDAIDEPAFGEQAQYQVRVTNDAHRDVSASIRGEFPGLHEASWVRGGGFSPRFSLNNIDGKNGFAVRGDSRRSVTSISGTGDINADGVDDFIYSRTDDEDGIAVVFTGGSQTGQRILEGPWLTSPTLGIRPKSSAIGDFNGDGINDFSYEGKIVFGAEALDMRPDRDVGMRVPLLGGGDINGDGFDDVVVARGFNPSAVIFGRRSGGSISIPRLDGTNGFVLNTGDTFRTHADIGGDINGDGFDDLVLLAQGRRGNMRLPDATLYVVFGGAEVGGLGRIELENLDGEDGFVINGFLLEDSRRGLGLEEDPTIVGDVNSDGFADILVPHDGPDGTDTYLILGSPSVGKSGVIDLTASDGSSRMIFNSEMPVRVRGFGDFNGDDVDDLVLAEWSVRPHTQDSAYVVFGNTEFASEGLISLDDLDGTKGLRLSPPHLGGCCSQLSAGDINADGVDDVIMHGWTRSSGSQIYVVYGADRTASGIAPIAEEEVYIPAGGAVTYEVTGFVADLTANVDVSVTGNSCIRQRDPKLSNNTASISIRVTSLAGDINLDNIVDFDDFLILAGNFGKTSGAVLEEGDLDGDEDIDFDDFLILAENFGRKLEDEPVDAAFAVNQVMVTSHPQFGSR